MVNYSTCPQEFFDNEYIMPNEQPYLAHHGDLGQVSVFGTILGGCPDKNLRGKTVVHRGEMRDGRIIYYIVDLSSLIPAQNSI